MAKRGGRASGGMKAPPPRSLSYPGVYVQELSTSHTVEAAPTSVAVFVGATVSGPENTPVQILSWQAYVTTFGGLAWGLQTPFAVWCFFQQGGGACWVVRAAAASAGAWVAAALTQGALGFSAAAPGDWGDNLLVAVGDYPDGAASPTPAFAIDVLYHMPLLGQALSVSDQLAADFAAANHCAQVPLEHGAAWRMERFSGFTAADLAPQGAGPCALATRINATSLFLRVAVSDGAAPRPPNSAPSALTGGAGDPTDTPLDLTAALASLGAVQGVSLLATPDVTAIADAGAQRNRVLQTLAWAETPAANQIFYLVDPPLGLSIADIEAFRTGAASADGRLPAGNALSSASGALYYPWILIPGPDGMSSVPVPPSGAMAGAYAATDTAAGVWKAPAGIDYGALRFALGVERPVTDTDQDGLNPIGINTIRSFTNYGICAWGARTLSSDPDRVYVNTRRLLTMIELSLTQGLQWVAFEPDNARLWAAVTAQTTAFLTPLWRQGALFGDTASEAFTVTCDASNNPPDTVAQGVLNLDLLVAPTYPAEFVAIRIQLQTATGA